MKLLLLTISSLNLLLRANAALSAKWQLTAKDLQSAHSSCLQLTPSLAATDLEQLHRFEYPDNSAVHAYIRCALHNMGLWTDTKGLEVKRITKIFSKYGMTTELLVVLRHCNATYQNTKDPDKWAFDAYACAASGKFGGWVQDYIKSVHVKKWYSENL